MISVKDMIVLEDNSEHLGVSKLELMENAGKSVYDSLKVVAKGKKVVIFCGSGNNSGDGFVAARYLSKICNVVVLFIGRASRLKKEGLINYKKIKNNKKINMVRSLGNVSDADILIDSMLGTGVIGDVREPYKSAIEKFNNTCAYKVAVDVPSGNICKCDLILTFHDKKLGFDYSKKTKVIDIGIPKDASKYVGLGDVDYVLGKRKPNSHKGDNGRVLVVGGSKDYSGAPILAGLAALRSGADWVTLAVPEKVGIVAAKHSLDLVIKRYKGDNLSGSHVNGVSGLSKGFDVVLIGNGIGLGSKSFCERIIKKIKKPKVIDADAIKAIGLKDVSNSIFTPHKRELEILLVNSGLGRLNKIKNNSQMFKEIQKHVGTNVIILKGPIDVVISSSKIKYNKTGNSGMTKAGTGDVLAGIAAGFVAQSKDLFISACACVYINGKIGDILLKKKKGYSYIASDMVDELKKRLN